MIFVLWINDISISALINIPSLIIIIGIGAGITVSVHGFPLTFNALTFTNFVSLNKEDKEICEHHLPDLNDPKDKSFETFKRLKFLLKKFGD